MSFRKLTVIGRGANGSPSIGISLDKEYLRYDDLLDSEGEPKETPMDVSRLGVADYRVRAVDQPQRDELEEHLDGLPTEDDLGQAGGT